MTPRITMMPVAARVESFTTGGIGAGGVGGDSTTGSPGCERLPTVAAELLARGDRLTALHARLARRRGHVRAAVPAELHRGGLLGVALRARLDLLRGLHLAHLARHRVAHADARSFAYIKMIAIVLVATMVGILVLAILQGLLLG